MNGREDSQFDTLLADHISRELSPQLGRCSRAFAAELRRPSHRRTYWMAIATMAACLLASIVLWPQRNVIPEIARVIPSTPEVEPARPMLAHVQREDQPQPRMNESVVWKTIDEGTVLVDGKYPARQIRQQILQRVQWFDVKQQAWIEMTVPREQVVLVALNTN